LHRVRSGWRYAIIRAMRLDGSLVHIMSSTKINDDNTIWSYIHMNASIYASVLIMGLILSV